MATSDYQRNVGQETDLPRLLDITEVADVLGVSVRHVRRLVFERRMPYLKCGRAPSLPSGRHQGVARRDQSEAAELAVPGRDRVA